MYIVVPLAPVVGFSAVERGCLHTLRQSATACMLVVAQGTSCCAVGRGESLRRVPVHGGGGWWQLPGGVAACTGTHPTLKVTAPQPCAHVLVVQV
jgi:acetyl-CoA acetyltransferase